MKLGGALDQVMATLNGLLTSHSDAPRAPRAPTFGPVPKAKLLEEAVDTGVPVSFVKNKIQSRVQ